MSSPANDRNDPAAPASAFGWLSSLAEWAKREPLAALLGTAVIATLVYFFGFYSVFVNGSQSTGAWAWAAWNSENDLEHGMLILPVALFVVWTHRAEMAAAPKSRSWLGLAIVFAGVVLFVLGARTLQARISMFALPVLGYGVTRFLWGKETARYVIFPCLFLLFMVPVGFLVSRTVGLQTMSAAVAAKLAGLIGIPALADGSKLLALDGSFEFEVAGGCSGIRSLTAMTTIAALFVHFTQKELWKKVTIFCGSIAFAMFGNFVRLFTVVVVAKFISQDIAGGLYHDYSGFVFFPASLLMMLGFSNLLNRDWNGLKAKLLEREKPAPAAQPAVPSDAADERKPAGPISYDY